jgi:serine protease Do
MKVWKTAAISGAFLAATALGVTAPVQATGQTKWVAAPKARTYQLLTGGGRLGVSVRDVGDDDVKRGRLNGSQGVVVDEVSDDSAAAKAGFKTGDIVVEFDGERVRSVRQFSRLVQETPAGREVTASVVRDGQKSSLKVVLEEGNGLLEFRRMEPFGDFGGLLRQIPPAPPRPPSPPAAPAPPAPPRLRLFEDFGGTFFFNSGTTLGITVSSLSPQLGEYFGTKSGVLVNGVRDDSAAAKAGLKAGDVLISINATKVNDPSAVRRAMNDLNAGAEFTLEIIRDKKPMTLKGKLETRTTRGRTIL